MAQAGNVLYDSPREIPAIVPVLPLEEALLLPRTQMPLNIFEDRYIAMVDYAMQHDRIIAMIQPAESLPEDDASEATAAQSREAATPPALRKIGCIGRITAYGETGDGRVLITLTGICRFRMVKEVKSHEPFRQITIDCEEFVEDLTEGFGEDSVDRNALLDMFRSYLDANDMEADWKSVEQSSNEVLVNSLAMMSPYGMAEKQALLEAGSLALRAETLIAITEMHLAGEPGGSPATLQ